MLKYLSDLEITPPPSLKLQGMSKEPFAFDLVSNRFEQLREPEQAFRLPAVIVREPFDFRLQNDVPLFVSVEVCRKVSAGAPDAVRARIDRGEDIE